MFGKSLTASELLENRGIQARTFKKWDKTTNVLPRTGLKHFEPNNSWLQKKQIEKGLTDRKDLLAIERVERSSQLGAAEWLPYEGRARVTKKSGQEWTKFGLEENGQLYLLPEEALLLIELNRLELTWNGVALSVQQAYSVLLDSDQSNCCSHEYRVYSQLVRQGYKLQRFKYEEDSLQHMKKKKRIHDPLSGFIIAKDLIEIDISEESKAGQSHKTEDQSEALSSSCMSSKNDSMEAEETKQSNKIDTFNDSELQQHPTNTETVEEKPELNNHSHVDCESKVPEALKQTNNDSKIQNVLADKNPVASSKKLLSEIYDNGVENLPGPSNATSQDTKISKKNGKLQIISDETLLGDFKVISMWPGARIPKNLMTVQRRDVASTNNESRNDKLKDSIEANHDVDKNKKLQSSICGEKRKNIDPRDEISEMKRSKYEVIELSDDEIEEIRPRMTRMEMLNLLPNLADECFKSERVSKKYCPPNVMPQRDAVQHSKWKYFRELKNHEKQADGVPQGTNNRERLQRLNVTNSYGHQNGVNFIRPFANPAPFLANHPYRPFIPNNMSPPAFANFRRFDNRNFNPRQQTYLQRNVVSNYNVSQFYNRTVVSNNMVFNRQQLLINLNFQQTFSHMRQLICNQNYFSNLSLSIRQQLLNFSPRFLPPPRMFNHHSAIRHPTPPQQRLPNPINQSLNNARRDSTEEVEASFRKMENCSSWSEMKRKLLEEKTITIDDDDSNNNAGRTKDDSEIAVVKQMVKPLVNFRNVRSFTDVFKRLQIIKQAPQRTIRKSRTKKTEYNISYNLFSSSIHFKKANPGSPMYRIVVIRLEDSTSVELADIIRLQQESKDIPILLAFVSRTSVNYAQLGAVNIPNV